MTPFEQLKIDVESSVDNLKQSIEHKQAILRFAETKLACLSDMKLYVETLGLYIDINRPTQEQKFEIIKRLGGTWQKELNAGGSSVDYWQRFEFEGLTISIRLYGAPPPPSCTLVRRTRFVPAREEIYTELHCGSTPLESVEE